MFDAITPGQATAANGAATLNQGSGTITTESVTTAAGSSYTLTLGNNQITSKSVILASVANGSNSQGDPSVQLVTPGSGQATIIIVNRHATQAFNGTLKIAFLVIN